MLNEDEYEARDEALHMHDEAEDADPEDELQLCHACNGSGEGPYDGTTCPICKGKGER